MRVNMGSRTTVKNLITALLEMPMESKVEICCIKDAEENIKVEVSCVYTTEGHNGKNTVIIANK